MICRKMEITRANFLNYDSLKKKSEQKRVSVKCQTEKGKTETEERKEAHRTREYLRIQSLKLKEETFEAM